MNLSVLDTGRCLWYPSLPFTGTGKGEGRATEAALPEDALNLYNKFVQDLGYGAERDNRTL